MDWGNLSLDDDDLRGLDQRNYFQADFAIQNFDRVLGNRRDKACSALQADMNFGINRAQPYFTDGIGKLISCARVDDAPSCY